MLAPVTSRISLILLPPLPINEPHWLAGTMRRRVMGGLGIPPAPLAPPPPAPCISWNCKHHCPVNHETEVKRSRGARVSVNQEQGTEKVWKRSKKSNRAGAEEYERAEAIRGNHMEKKQNTTTGHKFTSQTIH